MKNTVFSKGKWFLGTLFLVVAFAFYGCMPVNSLGDVSVYGKWVDNTKAVYEINQSTFKNYGETYDSYEGDNLVVVKDSDTAGRIFIKYTKAYCSTHSNSANYIYDSDAPDVGKWYAISYKNLTANSISISGAYGTKSSMDTLEEAKAEFTIENGYYSYYSECVKSN